jgi:signal transduction histidine kinase
MKRFVATAIIVAVSLLVITTVCAGAECTKEEVKKSVLYAADLLASKGRAAYPELEKFRFCGNEGYVWVSDMDGLMLMHPVSKKLVGVNQTALQDPKGKYFYAEMIHKAKNIGEGWISYYWLNPVTNVLEPKCSFVKATTLDGKKVWCGAGVYGIGEADCK